MAFSEKPAGKRENRLGFSLRVVCDPPVMLPLRFLPNPKEIERLESIDGRVPSCPTLGFDMLTGGYDFFAAFSSAFAVFFPKIELVLEKIDPMVFERLWLFCSVGAESSEKPEV